MRTRFLSDTGVQISELGLGTMAFGGDADEDASKAIYARARDAGINLFDTADVYQAGRAEEILGGLVAHERDEVVLASKFFFPVSDDVNARGASRRHVMRAVEASLERLETDRIDLYYVHRWDGATAIEETLRALDDLVRQGKVVYLGASNFAAWQVERALGVSALEGLHAVRAIQPMYNLVKRQAEVEILPMAAARNLAVIPYSPLGGGLLTGKYGRQVRPSRGRIVDNSMYTVRYGHEEAFAVAERFTRFARERGIDPVALAIAWVASHPSVTAPLIGARNVGQLEGALGAVDVEMTPALRAEIAALSPAPPPATDRNEEGTDHAMFAR